MDSTLSRAIRAVTLQADDVAWYLCDVGFDAYRWQRHVLESSSQRILIDGARQSGKSTLISGVPCHTARFEPGSLSIVLAATETQAIEDMERIQGFMGADPDFPALTRAGDRLVEVSNGSRILVVPATDRAARGFSTPRVILLDEASRIEDTVYASGVRSMLTNNPRCTLYAISTPNGRSGWFYRSWTHDVWERYLIRAPWDIDGSGMTLVPSVDEALFAAQCARRGIRGYYSPRHLDWEEQQENLDEMGQLWYRQEMLVEFVEPDTSVFAYDKIDHMFGDHEIRPLKRSGLRDAGASPVRRRA